MTKPPEKKLTQSDDIKFNLRLPRQMYAEVAAEAERNCRSMNAEIIARLQADHDAAVLAELAEVKSMLRKLLDNL